MRASTNFISAIVLATASGVVASADDAVQPEAKASVVAPSGTYTIDRSHSSIVFKVNHLGLADYVARFADFNADLTIDVDNPAASTLAVTIDPASIQTAYPFPERKDFDAELATDGRFFNNGEHADIQFVSTSIAMTGPDTAEITGDLTLLGVTKPVVMSAQYNGSLEAHPFSGNPMLGFSATTEITRSEFGMDAFIPQVGDVVSVAVEAEFAKRD